MFVSYSHKLGYTMASLLNLNRPDVWTWETDQVVGLGTRAMAMLWSEGLSLEGSKGIRKMVGQIDQAFYGALISSKRDVDDSEMDDRIGSGVRGLATRPV